ncbi:MAG: hypothetical protein ABJA98_21265 [Acidobacteriota bacterium]
MSMRTLKTFVASHAAVVCTLTGVLLALSGAVILAESRESISDPGIVGTWAVQVTLRNCDTNDPIGQSFNSLGTFQSGGTSIGSTASVAFAAGQRSSEHGIWSQRGRRTYDEKIVALIVFDTAPNLPGTPSYDPHLPVSPGLFAGWQTITHTIRLGDADHYTSAGTTAFYKADGTLYRTGCSTAIGERFE